MSFLKSATAMDVDCPVAVTLKRSSSAPMINEISASAMSVTSTSNSAPTRDAVSSFNIYSNSPRTRRFSTSSPGGGSVPHLTPRVSQLRQEECVDVAGREAAHEKEIHSAIQMSQSCEDLRLDAESLSFKDSESPSDQGTNKNERQNNAKRAFDPLSLNLSITGPPVCSSPSPTRSGLGQRQCYSPGFQLNWKNSLSPSPTRKAFATRRSQSPIRASCLGPVKRKFELDDNNGDQHLQPPAKKTSTLVISHSNRLEGISSSPLPGSLSSVGTPESLSSADSPNFSFRPVDSPSPGRILSSGDEPMSDSSGEQTKASDEGQSSNTAQHNQR